MRWVSLALASFVLLAGCAGTPGDGKAAPDAAFDDLGLDATETTGVIRGLVVDEAIRPVAGADILLVQGELAATSNGAGLFGFEGLAPGPYFLAVSKPGFIAQQAFIDVVAGVAEPQIVKVQLAPNPSTAPYVETLQFKGFLTFGASIGITSVGSTINPILSGALNDHSIWRVDLSAVPMWAQGELVWKQTQPAGGMLIWEMVQGGTNNFRGHRETTTSPALAYWNTSVLEGNSSSVLDDGIGYRFFGGPHPATGPGGLIPPENQCPTIPTGPVLGDRNPCRFGYGLTFQQGADAYAHHFYNFVPPVGWRFTVDGNPAVPR